MIKELTEAIKDMADAKTVYEGKVLQLKNAIEAKEEWCSVTLSHLSPYLFYINKEDEPVQVMTIDITNGMCKVIAVNIQKMSLEELTRLEKTIKEVLEWKYDKVV